MYSCARKYSSPTLPKSNTGMMFECTSVEPRFASSMNCATTAGLARQLGAQALDDERAPEPLGAERDRRVDLGHPAFAQLIEQEVAAEGDRSRAVGGARGLPAGAASVAPCANGSGRALRPGRGRRHAQSGARRPEREPPRAGQRRRPPAVRVIGRERLSAGGAGVCLRRRPMNSAAIASSPATDQMTAVVAAAVLSASCAAAAPLAYVHSHSPGTSGLTAAAQVPSLPS